LACKNVKVNDDLQRLLVLLCLVTPMRIRPLSYILTISNESFPQESQTSSEETSKPPVKTASSLRLQNMLKRC